MHISVKENETPERKIPDQQLQLSSQLDALPIKLLPTCLLVVMAYTSPITMCDRHSSNRGDTGERKKRKKILVVSSVGTEEIVAKVTSDSCAIELPSATSFLFGRRIFLVAGLQRMIEEDTSP